MGCSLLPKDPVRRAILRKLSEIINSGIQPLQNLSVTRHLPPDIPRDQWAAHWIQRGFNAFEAELQKVSGNYCVGDELSMANICLVPQGRQNVTCRPAKSTLDARDYADQPSGNVDAPGDSAISKLLAPRMFVYISAILERLNMFAEPPKNSSEDYSSDIFSSPHLLAYN
ncbi:maleylacetoacetate isomerase [Paragonimus westermani]|uniref:Maleylacetoacetate isomerase n=1 Tax=Paragonimus westermani TaxID=34504 RepID=A0A5J4NGW1_9TREM|nr:maleylacetoacetate isomerase [Paragonimus westermani]